MMFSNLFPDLNSVIILLPHLTFTNIILKNMSKNGIIIYIFQEVFSLSKIAGTIITIEDYLSPYFKEIKVNDGKPDAYTIIFNENRKYEIPLFQREIRWTSDNVKRLLSDLNSGSKFLGNIILSINSDSYEIIDGQQRTTIILLILYCIKKIHGNAIEVFDNCELINHSFTELKSYIDNDCDLERFDEIERAKIIESDKYKQRDRIKDLIDSLLSEDILKRRRRASALLTNINSNYGRFNSCFLCPRSFEGISFVGQRLVDQLIKDMDRSRKVAVTWVSIDLDVLDKLQSHFTGELLRSCVGLHTADILVHITLVLPCRFGTLSQLVLFSGQLILLCLILFKQADTHLFGNFACHLILVDALDKTVKLVDTLHNIVLPFPV